MSLSAKIRRAPLRVATGAYILNSGVGKFGADDDTAKLLQDVASGAYPFLGKMQPKMYAKALGAGEIAVGGALLLPIVSPAVAGAVLLGFSGALLKMYWDTPGMHEEGSPRPTIKGAPVAKDVWMFGIGAGLVADAFLEPAHDKVIELEATATQIRADRTRRAKRKAKKAAHKAQQARRSDAVKQARAAAADLQATAKKRARKAAKTAGKTARRDGEKASEIAAKAVAQVRAEYAPAAVEKAKQARDAARNLADEYGPVAVEKAKQARDAAEDAATWARERVAS